MAVSQLQQLIDVLTFMKKIHICIHDVSGILQTPGMSVVYENRIHSQPFCCLAKSTQAGYDACIECKNRANDRAQRQRSAFGGLCAFGLFEAVRPVVIEGKVVCIIYLGNMVQEEEKSRQQLVKSCRKTGAPFDRMEPVLADCERSLSHAQAAEICEALENCIQNLYRMHGEEAADERLQMHWIVDQLKTYADHNYRQSFTLESVCRLYFIHEKYAGGLFKKQMRMTFHEYLNEVRLQRAAELLISSPRKIIDIALSCGFNNVTYFNKKFRQRYGMAPGEYREQRGKGTC